MADGYGAVDECATRVAESMMGRTITGVVVRGHSPDCDGVNTLILTMTDGTVFEVIGSYGGYTGRSCDEYPEHISVVWHPSDNEVRS